MTLNNFRCTTGPLPLEHHSLLIPHNSMLLIEIHKGTDMDYHAFLKSAVGALSTDRNI